MAGEVLQGVYGPLGPFGANNSWAGEAFYFGLAGASSKAMLKVVTVKLPERLLNALDVLVKQGQYPNRSEAIRAAIRDLVKKELSV